MGGGLTKGPSHSKGGIKMKVKSTGQQIEVEGGEGIINKHVMSSKKKISYRGKKATPCEIASDLNQQTGNGVKFDCDETKNTDMTPTDPSTGFDKGGLLLAGILGYSLLSKDSSEAKTLETKQSDKVDSKFQDFISDVDNEGLDKILDGDYKDYDSITDKKFNKLFKNLQSSKKDLEKEVASIKDEDYKDEIEGFVDSEGFDYYFAQYMEGEKFEGKDLQDKVKKYQEDRDALVIYVDEEDEYSLAKGGKTSKYTYEIFKSKDEGVDPGLLGKFFIERSDGAMLGVQRKSDALFVIRNEEIFEEDFDVSIYGEDYEGKTIKLEFPINIRVIEKFDIDLIRDPKTKLPNFPKGEFQKGGAIESTIKTQTNPKHLEMDALEEIADVSILARGGQLEYVDFEDGTYYQYPRKRAMNILNRPLSDNELDELRYANSLIKYANDLTYYINNDNRYDLIAERDMQLQQANAMIEKLLDAEYQFAKGGLAKGGNYDTYIFDTTKWLSRDTRERNEILALLNKPSVNEEGSIVNTQTYVSKPYIPNVWTSYNNSNRTIWLNQKIIGRPSVLKGDYSIDTFVDIQLSKSNIYKVKPKAIQLDKLPIVVAEEGEKFFFPVVLDNIGVRKKGYIDESKDGYLIDKFLEENPQPTKPEEIFIPQSPMWDLNNFVVKFNVFKKLPNIKDLIVVPPSGGKGVQIGSYVDSTSGYDYIWYAKSIEYVASNIASPLIMFKGDYGSYITIDAFTGGVGGPPSYPLKPISSRRKLSDAKENIGESLWSMIMLNLYSEEDIKDVVLSAISMATPLDKRENVMKWFVENYWPDYSPDAVFTKFGSPNVGKFRKDVYEEKGLVQKYLSPSELTYDLKFYSYGNWNIFEPFYANSSEPIVREIEDYKLATQGKIIDIEYLDYRPTFKTRFFEGIPGSEIIADWEDWELKIPQETWLQIDALINDRLKDKKFLDRCVDFYNDRVIESVNETNLNGFLSPSYYIDMTEPEEVVKLSKEEKNINLFNTHPNKQEITRIQTLMSILDFDYQAKKQLNEEIRSLEDDMEVELNLDGKPHYNLKNAFKNFFKTADKKYVGKIGKQTEALAPDGEQSKLTTKQFDLVRTRQFMTWFGDWQQAFETKNYSGVSKCVNEDGEPKIVYHGTVSPFEWTKFSLGEDSSWTKDAPPVVYFAESKEYSNWFGSSKKTGKAGDDYVYEFFLNCRNPINLVDFGYNDLNIFDLEFLLKEKHGIEIDTTEIVARVPNIQAVKYPFWVFLRNYKRFGLGNMFDKFIALGYDSIQFVENNPSSIIDGKSEVTVAWVIFDKNQAKLGDGRNTTFSQFSDDFRFKKGGNVNR